ncbi:gag-pol polyprotein [Tanacetum coccineum]
MAETMEQYMSKTRPDYGSRIARPKIEDKDSFELKGQFLKELRDNTFSGLDHEDANEHIEKVLEIVDLFHIPNITIDQVMLRAFPMSLTGAASRWLRNKPSGSITTWEDLKTKFLSKYCPPARTAKKMEEINNFQQEPDENLYQAWERFKELLMKCPQHYLTEMQEVVLFYNGLDVPTRQILDSRGAIPSKTAADAKVPTTPKIVHSRKKGKPLKKLTTLNVVHLFKEGDIEKLSGILPRKHATYFIILDMPEDIKVPLILGRPFLSTAHVKIDVFKRKITLRVGEEKIFSKVLNLSLDPFFEDYIELNDLNVPLELRRDQVDDLMPTIKEGEVVEEFRARNDARMVSKFFRYPSDRDHDKKIRIDCALNLKFSCMIDFAVLEDMDAYRDERMGDAIFGEPFLREGRSSYAREMIELQPDVELKDTIMMAMPKLIGEGFYMCTIRVKYEWKPSTCSSCKVFGHVLDECPKKIVSDMVKNLKNPRQDARATRGNLNLFDVANWFDVANLVENDDDLGTDGGNSKSARKGSLTKLMFVDDDGKPIYKVDSIVIADSDSEVEEVETKVEDDYNPYDDDLYDGCDMPDNLQAFCDDLDIRVCGRKKEECDDIK